jgi:hypothetical protein
MVASKVRSMKNDQDKRSRVHAAARNRAVVRKTCPELVRRRHNALRETPSNRTERAAFSW